MMARTWWGRPSSYSSSTSMRLCTGDHDTKAPTLASASRINLGDASMTISRDARTATDHQATDLGWILHTSAAVAHRWTLARLLSDLEHLFAQPVGSGFHSAFHRAFEQKTGNRHRGVDVHGEGDLGRRALRRQRVLGVLGLQLPGRHQRPTHA